MLTLNGQVQMTNIDGSLWAERVVVERKTGDASADGGVKASYRQGGQGAIVHVLADRAEMKKASGTAFFHGSAQAAARLWQGGSQVEAPVLEFNQKQRNLRAHGEGAGAPMSVRTVLVSNGSPAPDSATGQTPAPASAPALTKAVARRALVVRVLSREMTYADATRKADFTGGVRVESADGVMRGERATALLEQAGAKKQEAPAGVLGGSVDRVTVNGAIEIDQPGRRATGDKLVYTAGDGLFVLTGTPATPPRVIDQDRGAVTGLELRFRAADESVVISNGERGGSGPRVHTETRVKRDR
jgi:lipopolysaccharide export system protein LptA